MSDRHEPPQDDVDMDDDASVANPFAAGDEAEAEKPTINLSKRRAASLGVMFGLVMVGLLLVCFLLSAALATCTGA